MGFADLDKNSADKALADSLTVAKHANYRAIASQVDVTDDGSVNNLILETVREFGRIDYAVNCAGVGSSRL